MSWFIVCNDCHWNLWQIYNTRLVEKYATRLYRYKSSCLNYFDKIIKLMILFSVWQSSKGFSQIPFYRILTLFTKRCFLDVKRMGRAVKTTSLLLSNLSLCRLFELKCSTNVSYYLSFLNIREYIPKLSKNCWLQHSFAYWGKVLSTIFLEEYFQKRFLKRIFV